MAKLSFAAQVEDWVRKVKGAEEAIFKASAQALASEMTDLVTQLVYQSPESPDYRRTGFLRASLVASTSAMPVLSLSNPGGSFVTDQGAIELVIAGSELGDTIYLGHTARYGAYVHYGANGRPARPWVDMAAQRWQAIVSEKAAELRRRLGL